MTVHSPVGGKVKRSRARRIALGCGAFTLLIVLLVAVTLIVVWRATAGPEEVVQEFLASAAAGDYATAHDHFCAPLKEQQPLPEFTAMVDANRQLFRVESTTFTERSVDLSGAELAGTVELDSGTKVPASFRLVKENDDWKLIAYNIGE